MNSHWFGAAGYAVLVGLALVARHRERSRASTADGVWPPFWILTGGLLAAMAIGRAGEIGPLLSDLERGRAIGSGWYESRRPLQTAAVVALGAGWWLTVSIACWRTPARRRRYLPIGIMVITLAAFAAIRVVSLHQVDALLQHRDFAGVRVGALVEITLLIVTGLTTAWVPPDRGAPEDRSASRSVATRS